MVLDFLFLEEDVEHSVQTTKQFDDRLREQRQMDGDELCGEGDES